MKTTSMQFQMQILIAADLSAGAGLANTNSSHLKLQAGALIILLPLFFSEVIAPAWSALISCDSQRKLLEAHPHCLGGE